MKQTVATLSALALAAVRVQAAVPVWGQCGGLNYTGDKTCAAGSTCVYSNDWYSQCLPSTATTTTTTTTRSTTTTRTTAGPTTTRITTTGVPPTSSTGTTTSKSTSTSRTTTSSGPVSTVCGAMTNPYIGYTAFISPYYVAEVNAAIATQTSATLKTKSAAVAKVPNFTWFDTASKVPTLDDYMSTASSMQTGGTKMLVQIVIYDLPNRDCHAKASNGEYTIANNGVANYQAYIDAISAIVSAHSDVRVVAVVEPDSLANLVTNLSDSNCQNAQTAYMTCTKYVLTKLQQCNIWLYLDAGHAGWLGWASNLQPAATLFANLYTSVKPNRVRGLATNVANYNALQAASPDPVTQGDSNYDEIHYINALAPLLSNAGFPASFIVDQGRSGVQNIRTAWGNWCNIKGAGFGLRPTTSTPASSIDAIVWVKPGGECDGTSDSSAPRYDSTCSLSDALQPAPQAGSWFEAYFEMLVNNANPAF